MLKDKLSQTGWKLKDNFLKRQNAFIEDKDRVDVFDSAQANVPVEKGGILAIVNNDKLSGDSDEVIILEY